MQEKCESASSEESSISTVVLFCQLSSAVLLISVSSAACPPVEWWNGEIFHRVDSFRSLAQRPGACSASFSSPAIP